MEKAARKSSKVGVNSSNSTVLASCAKAGIEKEIRIGTSNKKR